MARIEVNGIGLNVEVTGNGQRSVQGRAADPGSAGILPVPGVSRRGRAGRPRSRDDSPTKTHSQWAHDRAPLLLLHGFTGSVATWEAHLPALAAPQIVIAVDLIGHGASDAPADTARYSMPRCVGDLLALLDHLNVERVAVLGYSMGARVALHLAVAAPDRVAALVLESGSPGLADPAERATRRAADEALADRIERDGVEAFVETWERIPLFASQQALPPAVRLELRQQRLHNSAAGLANSLRGMGTGAQESLWGRLGEVAAPTLIVSGALDLKFRGIGEAMARTMPHATLEVVRDAGHAAHLERPGVFDRMVVEFLAEYSRPATGALDRRFPQEVGGQSARVAW